MVSRHGDGVNFAAELRLCNCGLHQNIIQNSIESPIISKQNQILQ